MSTQALITATYTTTTPDGARLKASEKITLCNLAHLCDDQGGYTQITTATLRDLANISQSTLQGALRCLEACGYITRRENPGYATSYAVHIEPMYQAMMQYNPTLYPDYARHIAEAWIDEMD